MTTTKKILLAAAVSATFGVAAPVWAGNILFAPDGGGLATAKEITAFDWFPGNALALDGNLSAKTSGDFASTVLAQSILSTATKTGQLLPVFDSSVLVPLDITFVLSVPEIITVNGVNDVDLVLDPAGSPNFFRIYVGGDSADFLVGDGFNAAGGATLILEGTITASTGSFTINDDDGDGSSVEVFDQAGGNNYQGVYTIEGNGSTTLQVNVGSFLSAYFPGGVSTLNLSFNTSLVDPFSSVDPSEQFYDGTSLVAANIGTFNGGNDALAASLPGGSNVTTPTGCNGVGDCDFQFQADANNSFTATAIPEPGSLALLGLGLLGLGGNALRGKRKSMAS